MNFPSRILYPLSENDFSPSVALLPTAAAGAVTGFWVLRRLRRYLDELEYHVFCEQPLFAQPQKGVLCRAEETLARADRAFAQRRHPRETNREQD